MAFKNKDREKEYKREWNQTHSEAIKQSHHKRNRKDGKYYQKGLEYERKGLRRQKNLVRHKHSKRWRKYKGNWLTETELHHEWIEGTAKYNGVAIVDKSEHQYGIINPIEILSGEIQLIGGLQ